MHFLRRNLKRILIDASGYLLIILGVAFGWLPGPGGIPLVIAGLGLLSINNEWAARLRAYLLNHGGKLVRAFFPPSLWVQWCYDIITLLVLMLVIALAWSHSHFWQISLAAALFFIAIFIAAMNRDRYNRIKHKN